MNFLQALQILRSPAPEGKRAASCALACGFTSLHLKAFLGAKIRQRLEMCPVMIEEGFFGDLPGNLHRLSQCPFDAIAAVVEWADIDPRLSLRSAAGWCHHDLPGILDDSRRRVEQLARALARAAAVSPTAVCLPTLPLPPMAATPRRQASRFETEIQRVALDLELCCSEQPGLRVLNRQTLSALSPAGERLDARGELASGAPYTPQHAEKVADLFVQLLFPPLRMKGLITDLDDTLWRGAVGEVGVENIHWHLERKSHGHAIYQQLLLSLVRSGTLVAVASKNDPAVVLRAFARDDLILKAEEIFPFEVGWGLKSKAVERILAQWNIDAGTVVFVDDSAIEVAEVKSVFPAMESVVFPTFDENALLEMIGRLRDWFGAEVVRQEDTLRRESIRQAAVFSQARAEADSLDGFLAQTEGSLTVSFAKDPGDLRPLELVNKTNQFNLNGRRYREAEWNRLLRDQDTVLMVVGYKDRYGPLGKIAVLAGRVCGHELAIDAWVMSCRAFSRRIEHHCLRFLFDRLGVDAICFECARTEKNGPLQEFFAEFKKDIAVAPVRLTNRDFNAVCPPLCHTVLVASHG
jgi:FkbH-like protein